MSNVIDWPMLRAILAVAEEGSMTGAAKVLGQSQPTISRLIRAAEEVAGGYLFERHERGLVATPFCQSLLDDARDMRESLQRASLKVAGEQPGLDGRVRITASVYVTTHILPPILAGIRARYPSISLDVVASDATDNLLFHEADIALRMYRPTQLDTVTKHLGDLPLGLYAAASYAETHGVPEHPDDLREHAMVGYDRDDRIIRAMREMGFMVTRRWFQTCTDDQVAYWNFVLAGCGIGVGQRVVAERTEGIVRVLPELELPSLPVWLTAHQRLRHQPRVAAVWEALAEGVGGVCG
ncbi:LysR family transcriptional regulator [Gymnodinialimonas hymeniacidonis]|uniref:LysR family transcriptional regulator n=1 Tax=Gymnodinialimonas hymeniacidonis TaxID=3126508 RepID=UPI0034C6DB4C